ncbi:major facilitator superfamily domain-containing protein [Glomus cerebriforme]|uniref:Major facilitator superfamily domain-containing protein n=1 Tax=Glomus cerebriforme TaxID=658196 RepID=A0A397SRT2_9GLOM|nr:major facilitator superfamily domain-containing protein [Glomus cerebriforme]RIA88890.1 major facilitator superfamily domain-containing protein [Glomus cerebriforme]
MTMLRYSSPLVQVIIVGFVCLLTSGMFNALTGIGGGGQLDTRVAANANVALYTCFAVGGLFAGAIVNKFGPSFSLIIGGSTYVIYSGSLLYYTHHQRQEFPVTAGAILGFGAALLWTGQGAIMLSYPTEDNKGKYIGLFWIIFNLGGVLGSLIPIALNWNGSNSGTVNDGTYIAFMVLMGLGALLSFALLSPQKVIHDDGKPVVVQKFPKWKNEIIGIFKLFLDWHMIALIPMFIASNWFYAYHFNVVNAGYFNIRTRSFNNLWYWAAQIVGAMGLGKFLDTPSLKRKNRGIIGLIILFVIIMGTWIGGLFFQLTFTRNDEKKNLDLFDSGYAGKLILYLLYGFNDAMYQCYAYWIMGSLTNDSSILARYTGFYKAIQSAGAAISWRIDAVNTPYLTELLICWALLAISFPCSFIVISKIKETNYDTDNAEKTETV